MPVEFQARETGSSEWIECGKLWTPMPPAFLNTIITKRLEGADIGDTTQEFSVMNFGSRDLSKWNWRGVMVEKKGKRNVKPTE